MLQELQNIREQLFDAPSDIKQAFNDVVNYFDAKLTYFVAKIDVNKGPTYNSIVSNLATSAYPVLSKSKVGDKIKLKDKAEISILAGPFKDRESAKKELDEIEKNK